VVALLLALGLAVPALAVTPQERLANPKLEGRAEEIGAQLRCLVCQNESIEDSNADLAHDIRLLLRQRLTAGDTDQQAIQYIVARYGQFVLLKPPIEPATWVLWYGPPALVVLALAGAVLWLRWRQVAPAAPLDAAERCRLDELLRESGPLSLSPTHPSVLRDGGPSATTAIDPGDALDGPAKPDHDDMGHDRRGLVAER
jgi:cytochrome c-type biogenesis protein CcmH